MSEVCLSLSRVISIFTSFSENEMTAAQSNNDNISVHVAALFYHLLGFGIMVGSDPNKMTKAPLLLGNQNTKNS